MLGVVAGIAIGFLASSNLSSTTGLSAVWMLQKSEATAAEPLSRKSEGHKSIDHNDQDDHDGWKVVNVFFGTRDHLPSVSKIDHNSFSSNKFFGQVGQDVYVSKLFREKRDGFFVDLASNDAVWYSNTYALETHYGWRGICVEAEAEYWPALSHRKCHVVGAVVGKDREDVEYVFRDIPGHSGIVGEQFDNTAELSSRGRKEPRRTVSLEEIFRKFNAPSVIDYFSFDVEGAEDLVLQPSVLAHYRFSVMTIERPKQVLKDLLSANGYKLVKVISDFGETLWVHSLALPELDLQGAGIDVPVQA